MRNKPKHVKPGTWWTLVSIYWASMLSAAMLMVEAAFGQAPTIPGVNEAVNAAGHHSYEAVVMVGVVCTVFALFTWAVKSWISQGAERETRMADRVTTLEDKITERLFVISGDSCRAMNATGQSLAEITQVLKELRDQMEHISNSLAGLEALIKSHDAQVESNIKRIEGARGGGGTRNHG